MWIFDATRPFVMEHSPCCTAPPCDNNQATARAKYSTMYYSACQRPDVTPCPEQIVSKMPDIMSVLAEMNDTQAAGHIFRVLGVTPSNQTIGRIR